MNTPDISQTNPQEEKEQEEISLRELTLEEIKQLLKKAITEGSPEAKYILQITEWNRPGQSFRDYGKSKILYGEIEKILIDERYDYPTTNEKEYLIIPKTRVVVLLFEHGNDYEGELQEHAKLYVFSYPKGWVSLELY